MKKLLLICLVFGLCGMAFAEDTNITGSLLIRQKVSHQLTDDLGIETTESFASNAIWYVEYGTAAGQMGSFYSVNITLTNLASTTIDLYGGLTNRFGKEINLGSIKWFQFSADASNHGSMSIGDETAHWSSFLGATNHTITARPGAELMIWVSGTNDYDVVDTTSDIFKVTNDDAGAAWTNSLRVWFGGVVE